MNKTKKKSESKQALYILINLMHIVLEYIIIVKHLSIKCKAIILRNNYSGSNNTFTVLKITIKC